MNKIKNAANRMTEFVADHKVGLTVAATTLVFVKLNKMALRDHDNFLKEHGLYEKFYTVTEESFYGKE